MKLRFQNHCKNCGSLAQRWAHLFPSHHETLKRSKQEGGKALDKVEDQVVAESLENLRTNRCVNLMGLFIVIF